jgi:tetratricopeptide (TPR) repeat protein/transcriptional regulator with XRE-family HTH domain
MTGAQEAIVDHRGAVLCGPGDMAGGEDMSTAGGRSFGDHLHELRTRRQLTQEALADLTGLSVRTLRYLESGRIRQPRRDTVQRLTDGLELAPAERRVLEEALTAATTSRMMRPEAAAYLTWLPPDVPFFVGREEQLRDMDRLISRPHLSSEALTTAVVSGVAGIGKSALAVHWGHRNRDAFPDGQLYLNLRGFDPYGPPMPPVDAVRIFLSALRVPPQRIPSGLTERIGLYRTITSDKRILVILDNARDADQVRPLLPGGAGPRVVVTSRNPMLGLVATDAARPIVLDILRHPEARELLRQRLGHDRIDDQDEAVSDIISRCACLPLALALVTARAATHPRYALGDLADELRRAADTLDVIVSDEAASDLRTVFSWSYRSLTQEAARTFRLLGLHPGPDVSLDAVASLVGLAPAVARPLLGQMAGAGLVAEPVPGRFVMHDLLRAYAGELSALESPEQRRRATARVLDHYLGTAIGADRRMDPHRDAIDIAPIGDGVALTPVPDRQTAQAWLDAEHQVLVRMVSAAADAGLDVHAWQLAWALVEYLDIQGYWNDIARTQRMALAAAGRLGNRDAEGRALRQLANADIQMGNLDLADQHLQQSLQLSAARQDDAGQANTHINLAVLRERQERFGDANAHALRALELYRRAGHRVGEGIALNSLGYGYALAGDLPRALRCCTEALAVNNEIDHRKNKAHTFDSLGYIYAQLHDFDKSAGYYREALMLFREFGNRYNEADALINLGDVARDSGDGSAAKAAWRKAAAILDEIDHPRADQVRERLATAAI